MSDEWTSASGGSVVEWLQRKTAGSEGEASRGAIDYITKVGLPKPRSRQQAQVGGQHDTPATPPTAGEGDERKTAVAPSPPLAQPAPVPGKNSSLGMGPPAAYGSPLVQPSPAPVPQMGAPAPLRIPLPPSATMVGSAPLASMGFVPMTPEIEARQREEQRRMFAMEERRQLFDRRYAQQSRARVDADALQRLDVGTILQLIDEHDVTFICTDTGSGKSTRIPGALLERSATARIVSTQPRRTATISVANHVASTRSESVGGTVGYWIRGEKVGTDATRLWYMTSYTLLLYLLHNPLRPPFTHVILDEFHERQPDLEVTVALLKMCLKRRTSPFKLIIMSATINTEEWDKFFDGLEVAVYKQSEPEHPIHDYFLEDVGSLLGMDCSIPQYLNPHQVDHQLLERHTFVAQTLITFLNSVTSPSHSVLVFLPGRAQVEFVQQWAEMHLAQRVDIIAWHSAVDLSHIREAISRRSGMRQKIYLATDIAEVSITLPDVVFVVDLVLVKRPQIIQGNPATIAYPPLMMQWGSKSNIAQRRGRVGRVQQGFYFCLTWPSLISRLPDYSPPPIENSRIDELALHSLQLCANPAALFTICRGQPLLESVATSMNALMHMGCIMESDHPLAPAESITEMYDNAEWSAMILDEARQFINSSVRIQEYQTTFIGRLLQLIPVASQPGLLVFFGFLTGLESLLILAAAVCNSLSPFAVNPEKPRRRGGRRGGQAPRENVAHLMEATERLMKTYGLGARSDVVSVMGAVLEFLIKKRDMPNEAAVKLWCANHHLSHEKLTAIVDLVQHIKFELEAFLPFRDVQDPAELQQQLAKLSSVVIVLSNAAFAAQALEVTNDGSMKTVSREGAVGLFTDLRAVPDLHSPSCLRWEPGDIIVPISMSLHYSRLLVGSATVTGNHRQFWLSLLLFTYRLRYAHFSDERGPYSMYCITYCDRLKVLEVDWKTSQHVLEFRRKCSTLGQTLRLRYRCREEPEETFSQRLQDKFKLETIEAGQRAVITDLASIFTQEALDNSDIAEVLFEDIGDIDTVSILSFAIPPT